MYSVVYVQRGPGEEWCKYGAVQDTIKAGQDRPGARQVGRLAGDGQGRVIER